MSRRVSRRRFLPLNVERITVADGNPFSRNHGLQDTIDLDNRPGPGSGRLRYPQPNRLDDGLAGLKNRPLHVQQTGFAVRLAMGDQPRSHKLPTAPKGFRVDVDFILRRDVQVVRHRHKQCLQPRCSYNCLEIAAANVIAELNLGGEWAVIWVYHHGSNAPVVLTPTVSSGRYSPRQPPYLAALVQLYCFLPTPTPAL